MFGRKRRRRERLAAERLRFALERGRQARIACGLPVEHRDAILAHLEAHGVVDPWAVFAMRWLEDAINRARRPVTNEKRG